MKLLSHLALRGVLVACLVPPILVAVGVPVWEGFLVWAAAGWVGYGIGARAEVNRLQQMVLLQRYAGTVDGLRLAANRVREASITADSPMVRACAVSVMTWMAADLEATADRVEYEGHPFKGDLPSWPATRCQRFARAITRTVKDFVS